MRRWIKGRIRETVQYIKVYKPGTLIVVQTESAVVAGIRFKDPIHYNVRYWVPSKVADQQHTDIGLPWPYIHVFALTEFIVVHIHVLEVRIIVWICKRNFAQDRHRKKTDHTNTDYVIGLNGIVEYFNIARCHHKDTGTGRRNRREASLH